ncbi:hypothetical protein [Allocoleopsis franciscana]|uniref:Uncharacterized protein n=1 Tax=Allocoleopsis franciscana PCC 7113 TaxID=1173027 RepID=K9WRF4_9CYAN|nr:hypothetical protein [Allocoleopsis franciscana]AFZ22364.1 hypothetical protein Mic7113_6807 [Allocoleopsis franciscana PCC 7113]
MGTDKPRIQSYLEPEVYRDLQEFQALQGLRESAAVNQILKEYFGWSDSSASISSFQSPSLDELKLLIQEELWGEGKSDFIDGIKAHAKNVIAEEVTEAKEYWHSIDTRERVDRHQIEIAKLQERIETLEKICQPIEEAESQQNHSGGLQEIQDRLEALEDSVELLLNEPATPTSNSLDLTRSPLSTARYENVKLLPEAISVPIIEAIEGGKVQEVDELSNLPSELNLSQLAVEDFQWTGDNAIELNLSQLARRLGISKSVLSRRKSQADFLEWSKANKAKDPEGRTWHYNPERQIFRGMFL